MNIRYTLVLLAILIALGCYIKFVDEKKPSTDEAKKKSSRVLPGWSPVAVEKIRIKNANKQEIVLRRQQGIWTMTEPLKRRADASTVERILGKLEDLQYLSRFTGKDEEYGLEENSVFLETEELAGRSTRLTFGSSAPMGDRGYLKIGGESDIFVVGKDLRDLVDKDASAFRDPQITHIELHELISAEISEKEQKIILAREDGFWVIKEPPLGQGDQKTIDTYLRKIIYLTANRFAADAPDALSSWGLDNPWLSIKLETDKKSAAEILFGNRVEGKEAETYYVFESSVPTVYEIEMSRNDIAKTLLDFRNKNILTADPDRIDQIMITAREGQMALKREDTGHWSAESTQAEPPEEQQSLEFLAEDLIRLKFTQIISQSKERFIGSGSGFASPLLTLLFLDHQGQSIGYIGIYDAVSVSDHSLLLAESSQSNEVYLVLRSSLEPLLSVFYNSNDASDTSELVTEGRL